MRHVDPDFKENMDFFKCKAQIPSCPNASENRGGVDALGLMHKPSGLGLHKFMVNNLDPSIFKSDLIPHHCDATISKGGKIDPTSTLHS